MTDKTKKLNYRISWRWLMKTRMCDRDIDASTGTHIYDIRIIINDKCRQQQMDLLSFVDAEWNKSNENWMSLSKINTLARAPNTRAEWEYIFLKDFIHYYDPQRKHYLDSACFCLLWEQRAGDGRLPSQLEMIMILMGIFMPLNSKYGYSLDYS